MTWDFKPFQHGHLKKYQEENWEFYTQTTGIKAGIELTKAGIQGPESGDARIHTRKNVRIDARKNVRIDARLTERMSANMPNMSEYMPE